MAFLEEISVLYVFLILVIVLLVLIIFFRVRLKFTLIRLFYGRYHYKYLKLFNRYFINRPYPDAIKDEPWDYVQNIFNLNPELKFETEEDIKFIDLKVGDTYPGFFKKYGDPDYLTISDPHQKQMQFIVAGYKAMVYDYEAMLVYFFADSMLVMGQFRFRREKQPIETSHLIKKLSERYKIDVPSSLNKPFRVIDGQGNCINFRDNGFSVELNILNHQNDAIRKLIQQQPSTAFDSPDLANKQVVTF